MGSGTQSGRYGERCVGISILPLRGEWDYQIALPIIKAYDFNPPTPWGVGRKDTQSLFLFGQFQSSHSVGSGTISDGTWDYSVSFQSSHSVGSGTIMYTIQTFCRRFQSSHSVGSGTSSVTEFIFIGQFQSSHSVGSGTGNIEAFAKQVHISILPLRGEWDVHYGKRTSKTKDFNPPTPWGVGHVS